MDEQSQKEIINDAEVQKYVDSSSTVSTPTYFLLTFLGVGLLFPWNSIITAVDYFDLIYPNAHVNFNFAFLYTLPNFTGIMCTAYFGRKLPLDLRIYGCLLFFLVEMLMMPFLKSLPFTEALVFITGLTEGILQASLYGFSSLFPPIFNQGVVAGTAVSGTVVSFCRIFTKLSLTNDVEGLRISAIIFFAISATVMFSCLFIYWQLVRLPFVQNFANIRNTERNSSTSSVNEVGILNEENDQVKLTNNTITNRKTKMCTDGDINYRQIVSKIWKYGLIIGVNFFITLMIFPGIISEIKSTTPSLQEDWFPIILITLFNVFDLAGRIIAKFVQISKYQLLSFFTFSRFVFLPLFILNLNNDFFPILFMIIFATSNGYIATICMMHAPTLVDINEKEVTGIFMCLFTVFGLTLGSIVGFALQFAIVK